MDVFDRFRLDGRVAVVTGGTRGLGKGFAEALGSASASVVLVGRDAETGGRVLAELEQRGVPSRFVRADITVPEDVDRMLA